MPRRWGLSQASADPGRAHLSRDRDEEPPPLLSDDSLKAVVLHDSECASGKEGDKRVAGRLGDVDERHEVCPFVARGTNGI